MTGDADPSPQAGDSGATPQADAVPPAVAALNHDQRRALAVTLRLLEERLAEIGDMLDHGSEGVLYRRPAAALGPAQRAEIETLTAEIRHTVASLAALLALPCERQDPIRRISGLLNVSWEGLRELDARRLQAYGPVDPALRRTLDPVTEHLADLVLELQRTVATERAVAPAPAPGDAGRRRRYDTGKRRAR